MREFLPVNSATDAAQQGERECSAVITVNVEDAFEDQKCSFTITHRVSTFVGIRTDGEIGRKHERGISCQHGFRIGVVYESPRA